MLREIYSSLFFKKAIRIWPHEEDRDQISKPSLDSSTSQPVRWLLVCPLGKDKRATCTYSRK